jgi:16S rRNA (guanine966-N2)-methyltransferase
MPGVTQTRITAGEWRGRLIKTPRGRNTRPTSAKVREALFDILGPRVEGAHVLDLFAGAGTFSFEALSRGAAHATMVERDRGVAKLIAATCMTLGCIDQVEIEVVEAKGWVAAQKTLAADIVWLDPPYADDAIDDVLTEVCKKTEGLVVCEHQRRRELAQAFGSKSLARRVNYGQTTLSFYEGGQ